MSAILFLFERKLVYFARWWLLAAGYDTRRRDLIERIYGLYIFLILALWSLLMLSYMVVTATTILRALSVFASNLHTSLFFALSFWLALTPWLAQRSYDLYRFSLPDLDFLGTAPISPRVTTLWWFLKSLFTRWSGIFVLGCGIIGSALSTIGNQGDLVGLAAGLMAGVSFYALAGALVWLLGLLRYYPVPRFGAVAGYILSALGICLLLLPTAWVEFIFWPAWLASGLIVDLDGANAWAVAGLVAANAGATLGVYLVARRVLLTPAFEEGRLGGQLRRVAGRGLLADDARIQLHLSRRLARGHSLPTTRNKGIGTGTAGGPVAALFRKEWLHMRRLPPVSLLIYAVVPVILGAAIMVALAVLGQSAPRIEILAPTTFFANLALIRTGTMVMRGNLAHLDFFAGWPISRLRLMLFGIMIGFGLPLISGELALVVTLFVAPGVAAPLPWLILWPVLVAISALIALLDMQRLLKRWSSAPETLPDNSPGAVLIASLIWLAIEYLVN